MRLLHLVVLLLPLAAQADNTSPPMAPPTGNFIGVIRYETTPGKPMELAKEGEPAERITARRDDKGFTLLVARNVGKDYEQGRAALTEAEWLALEDIINKRGLLEWRPARSKQQAFDYSTAELFLGTREGKTANRQHWSQPLTNAEPAIALANALGKLAKAKIKHPRLYYFGD